MKKLNFKSVKTSDNIILYFGIILLLLCFTITFTNYNDVSVLDMCLFDGYLKEAENGTYYISTNSISGECRIIQGFNMSDLSGFYVKELEQYRIEPNSKQIIVITKENGAFGKRTLEQSLDVAPVYVLQKDGTYANTSDGTKLTMNNGTILNADMINGEKYYYDSGNPYYTGWDSCLKLTLIEKIFSTFKTPLVWMAIIYLISCILIYTKKKLCSKYMIIIGDKKELSIDTLMQNMNKGYDQVLKDLHMLKSKKFLNNYTVDFDKRIIYFNSEIDNKSSSNIKSRSLKCPACGAQNNVTSARDNKCEYCGTILE